MYYLLLGVAVLGIAANFSLNKVYQMRAPTTFGAILRKTIPLVLLQGLMFASLSGFSLIDSGKDSVPDSCDPEQ